MLVDSLTSKQDFPLEMQNRIVPAFYFSEGEKEDDFYMFTAVK